MYILIRKIYFKNIFENFFESVDVIFYRRSKTRENGRPSTAEGLSRIGPRHVPYRNSLLTMVLRDSLGGYT